MRPRELGLCPLYFAHWRIRCVSSCLDRLVGADEGDGEEVLGPLWFFRPALAFRPLSTYSDRVERSFSALSLVRSIS